MLEKLTLQRFSIRHNPLRSFIDKRRNPERQSLSAVPEHLGLANDAFEHGNKQSAWEHPNLNNFKFPASQTEVRSVELPLQHSEPIGFPSHFTQASVAEYPFTLSRDTLKPTYPVPKDWVLHNPHWSGWDFRRYDANP